jgi:hypothetical protein
MSTIRWNGTRVAARAAALAAVLLLTSSLAALAQPGSDDGPGRLFTEPPPVVADYFPTAYRQTQLLPSSTVDGAAGTVTLPLHQGRLVDGRSVWFVLTDASDRSTARRLRLNWSPKLAQAPAAATRTAQRVRGALVFDRGAVDFRPQRRVVPGEAPDFFPPAVAEPGSIGDSHYSPLVRVRNERNVVYNATVVAFDVAAQQIEFPNGGVDHSKVIDRAIAISPRQRTVTFSLNVGTSSDRPVLFVSLDSNSPVVSALEATTYAPALSNLAADRDDADDSAVSANYIVTNGPTGKDNPQRQGVDSALSDPDGQVLDVFDGAPGVLHGRYYSPMWALYLAQWTPEAIAAGFRARIGSELEALALSRRGWLTAPGGGSVTASGLISNCPLIATS